MADIKIIIYVDGKLERVFDSEQFSYELDYTEAIEKWIDENLMRHW